MNNLNKLEYPSCKKHSINSYMYISTNIRDQDDIFKCGQCVLEDINYNDYLYINTILMSQDDYIFKNWPLLCNKELINQLNQLVQDYTDPIQIIEDQFNSLRNEIVQKIDEKKKKTLQKLQNLRIDKEEIHNIYNQISCKDNLKQILAQNESFEKINKDLQAFLQTSFVEKKQKNLQIQILIEKIKKYQQSPQIFEIEELKNNMLDHLDSLDDEFDRCDVFSEEINKIQQQLDLMIKDQQSKTENNNFEQEIDKYLKLFNFKYLYDKASSNESNQINLLHGKQEFTDYKQSKEIKVTIPLFEDYLQIYKSLNIQFGYVYFKYPMSKHKKYICKIRFNDSGGQYIIVGLINSNNLLNHLNLSQQGKSFVLPDKKYGGQIVTGEYFSDIANNFILTMIIDIQNSQIYFCDEYEGGLFFNINELQNQSLLDAESTYYLTFHFGKQQSALDYETKIDLLYFQEVDNQ
ncbi:hypothetical protein TTHERM_000925559 (macronuclear) [Tetrahymena thermophila SB210]|uniref:Uncharacterized protein n=1 Tax=Tetrahymena thermophila (strain SB210) TaxID=312017 RepID=W7WZX0_TETTS|nr:hypothetical protein TTHERM_000925559 [Tetrahymena thermophila SB210]EWS72405.1 hypothetical protein TTHERM_000925559 [Tetrahymena thermophila SB210]|eukprot:XP_012655061.1 hypothetical protein TTHERM_000925559 [Tetrahymena thermophila SB210]